MATSQAFEVPFAGKWKEFLICEDGEEIVPEPVGDEANKKIWTAQVMILFSVWKNTYAFLWPLSTTCRDRIERGEWYFSKICNLWT
jgi:hypothetical protein